MVESTRIRVSSQEEYEWLDSVRVKYGLTWRGMLLKAEQRLLAAERHWPEEFRTPEHLIGDAHVDADDTVEMEDETGADTDEVVG